MSDVTIQPETLDHWKGPTSGVEIWLVLDQPITTPEGKNYGMESEFVIRAACTMVSATENGITQYSLQIPQLVVPATANALVGRTARYTASFYSGSGTTRTRYGNWTGLDCFFLNPSPTTQSWANIRLINNGGVPIGVDNRTFTRSEIYSLLGGFVSKANWATPLPTANRTALTNYMAGVLSGSYNQSEVQAIADRLEELYGKVAALIRDVKQ